MPKSAAATERGVKHLSRADPVLKEVIRRAGPFTLKPRTNRFQSLVYSILSQQISTKAADAIRRKFLDLVGGPARLTPEIVSTLSVKHLRAAGLSKQKASYILDLANRVRSGTLPLNRIARMSNDEVIATLIEVKGIGEWTAHMFLMFQLGRLDVWPTGDFGVRNGYSKMYGLPEMLTPKVLEAAGEPFRPYRSIVAWWCWRAADTVTL